MDNPQQRGSRILFLHDVVQQAQTLRDDMAVVRFLACLLEYDAVSATAAMRHGAAQVSVDMSALVSQLQLVPGNWYHIMGRVAADCGGPVAIDAVSVRDAGPTVAEYEYALAERLARQKP